MSPRGRRSERDLAATRDSGPVLGGVQAPRAARPLRACGLDPACAPGKRALIAGRVGRLFERASRTRTTADRHWRQAVAIAPRTCGHGCGGEAASRVVAGSQLVAEDQI